MAGPAGAALAAGEGDGRVDDEFSLEAGAGREVDRDAALAAVRLLGADAIGAASARDGCRCLAAVRHHEVAVLGLDREAGAADTRAAVLVRAGRAGYREAVQVEHHVRHRRRNDEAFGQVCVKLELEEHVFRELVVFDVRRVVDDDAVVGRAGGLLPRSVEPDVTDGASRDLGDYRAGPVRPAGERPALARRGREDNRLALDGVGRRVRFAVDRREVFAVRETVADVVDDRVPVRHDGDRTGGAGRDAGHDVARRGIRPVRERVASAFRIGEDDFIAFDVVLPRVEERVDAAVERVVDGVVVDVPHRFEREVARRHRPRDVRPLGEGVALADGLGLRLAEDDGIAVLDGAARDGFAAVHVERERVEEVGADVRRVGVGGVSAFAVGAAAFRILLVHVAGAAVAAGEDRLAIDVERTGEADRRDERIGALAAVAEVGRAVGAVAADERAGPVDYDGRALLDHDHRGRAVLHACREVRRVERSLAIVAADGEAAEVDSDVGDARRNRQRVVDIVGEREGHVDAAGDLVAELVEVFGILDYHRVVLGAFADLALVAIVELLFVVDGGLALGLDGRAAVAADAFAFAVAAGAAADLGVFAVLLAVDIDVAFAGVHAVAAVAAVGIGAFVGVAAGAAVDLGAVGDGNLAGERVRRLDARAAVAAGRMLLGAVRARAAADFAASVDGRDRRQVFEHESRRSDHSRVFGRKRQDGEGVEVENEVRHARRNRHGAVDGVGEPDFESDSLGELVAELFDILRVAQDDGVVLGAASGEAAVAVFVVAVTGLLLVVGRGALAAFARRAGLVGIAGVAALDARRRLDFHIAVGVDAVAAIAGSAALDRGVAAASAEDRHVAADDNLARERGGRGDAVAAVAGERGRGLVEAVAALDGGDCLGAVRDGDDCRRVLDVERVAAVGRGRRAVRAGDIPAVEVEPQVGHGRRNHERFDVVRERQADCRAVVNLLAEVVDVLRVFEDDRLLERALAGEALVAMVDYAVVVGLDVGLIGVGGVAAVAGLAEFVGVAGVTAGEVGGHADLD